MSTTTSPRRCAVMASALFICLSWAGRVTAEGCDAPVNPGKLSDPNLDAALVHNGKNEFADAKTKLVKVLEKHPCIPGPLYQYGRALEGLGEYRPALEAYRTAGLIQIESASPDQGVAAVWALNKRDASAAFSRLAKQLLQQTTIALGVDPPEAALTRQNVTPKTLALSIDKSLQDQLPPTFDVEVDAQGYVPFRQTVTAELGRAGRVKVELRPATCASSPDVAFVPLALAAEGTAEKAPEHLGRLNELRTVYACVPRLWLELGRAHEAAHDYGKALESYDRGSKLKPPEASADLSRFFGDAVKEAGEARKSLKEKLEKTTLTVRATTGTGTVPLALVKGEHVAVDTPIQVPPGVPIGVEVSAYGFESRGTTVEVKLGEHVDTELLELVRDKDQEDENAGRRTFGFITAITGGAVLLAGATTFILAAIADGEASDACPGNVCSNPGDYETVERGRTLSTVTDILVPVGFAMGCVGFGFYMANPPPDKASNHESFRTGGTKASTLEKPILFSVSGRF